MRGSFILVILLTFPALVSASEPPLSGPFYLDYTLTVGPRETLTIGPGTSITGPGRIEVWGTLDVTGSPDRPAEIAVPILLLGNGTSTLTDARLWGVNTTALTLRHGNLTLLRVAFEGNSVGLDSTTPGRVSVRDALFRAHATQALRVTGASDVLVDNASFEDGQAGLTLDINASAIAIVTNSTFERNAQHASVQLHAAPADVRFERDMFGPPVAMNGTVAPALALRGPPIRDGIVRRITLANDSFLAGDVALRVEGAGVAVESAHDRFLGNRVGVSLSNADITLRNDSFNSRERDIDGDATSAIRLEGVAFSPVVAVPAATEAPGVTLSPWALPVALVVLASGGAALALRRKAPPAPALDDAPEPLKPRAPPPAIELPLRLKPLERRILEDIVANPGSAQSAVATRLGFSRQALHYHVKKLEARGLLTKAAHGRETRCFAAPGVDGALDVAPSTRLGSEEKP